MVTRLRAIPLPASDSFSFAWNRSDFCSRNRSSGGIDASCSRTFVATRRKPPVTLRIPSPCTGARVVRVVFLASFCLSGKYQQLEPCVTAALTVAWYICREYRKDGPHVEAITLP